MQGKIEYWLQETMKKYSEKHNTKNLVITGHSLGGAIATLSALDLKK